MLLVSATHRPLEHRPLTKHVHTSEYVYKPVEIWKAVLRLPTCLLHRIQSLIDTSLNLSEHRVLIVISELITDIVLIDSSIGQLILLLVLIVIQVLIVIAIVILHIHHAPLVLSPPES